MQRSYIDYNKFIRKIVTTQKYKLWIIYLKDSYGIKGALWQH